MDQEKNFIEISTNIISEIFISTFGSIMEYTGHKFRELGFLNMIAKEYAENMYERFNYISIYGMSDKISLHDLYVRVNIMEKSSKDLDDFIFQTKKMLDLRDSEIILEELRLQKRFFGNNISSQPVENVINKSNKIIVLGKPGAGKTTLLKYIALQNIANNKLFLDKKLPIFISLNKHIKDQSLFDSILKQFEACNIKDVEDFVKRLLEKGKCIVLFDGLDEVGELNISDTIQQINDFSDKYNKNKYLISCRIAYYNYWLPQFKTIEVSDFDNQQIEVFVNNWFSAELEVGEKCLESINENNHLRELASIPLLLTLLCINFDINYEFPKSRAELYQLAIDALLSKWDSTRRISRDNKPKWMSPKLINNLLSKIAFDTFRASETLYKKNRLLAFIEKYIKNISGFDENSSDFDSAIILSILESNHGIFIERANNIYSFSHLTIQEFFCAKYIKDNLLNVNTNFIIDEFLYNQNWREVIVVVAHLLSDPNQYIEYIHLKLYEFVQKSYRLKRLVGDVQFLASGKQIDIKTRILILTTILLHAYNYSKSNYVKKDEIKSTEIEACVSVVQRIADLVEVNKIDFNWAGNIASDLERAEKLTSDMVVFIELVKYLKGLSILIECLYSNLYLQSRLFDTIQNEVLTIRK